ncbi:glycoside hydrolase family 27 protein [Apiospora arundinis]
MPPAARVELAEIETDLQYFRAHGVLPALGETQFDEELDNKRNHRHQLAVDNAVLRARLGYQGRHIIEEENEAAPEPGPMIHAAVILETSYQITSGISQVSPSLLLAAIFLVEQD